MTVSEEYFQQARKLISQTGNRVTKPRLETLAALLSSNKALSHGDLRKLFPTMDRVSLYRSLEWLLDHQLVYRIETNGQHLYNANDQHHTHHHHPHFCCNKCGLSTCLSDPNETVINVPSGFKITEIELIVKGLCSNCSSLTN